MKTTIHHLVIAFLLLSLGVIAQSSGKINPQSSIYLSDAQVECIYEYRVNAPVRGSATNEKMLVNYKTILQTNSSVSKFWDWHSFKKDSIIYFSENEISKDSASRLHVKYYGWVENLFLPVIIKNYPLSQFTVLDEIVFDDYEYNEKIPDYNWVLQDDTMTVCGYICNKAIASVGGLQWTAWYTPEVFISSGPWKLSGLPGLIMKAIDESSTHTFEAVSIRNSNLPIYIARNAQRFKTTKKNLEKKKVEYDAMDSRDVFGGSIKDLRMLDDRRVDFMRPTLYCPLEKL